MLPMEGSGLYGVFLIKRMYEYENGLTLREC